MVRKRSASRAGRTTVAPGTGNSGDGKAVRPAMDAPLPASLDRARSAAVAHMMAEAGHAFSASLDVGATVRSIGSLIVGWFAEWCVIDLYGPDDRFERVEVAAAEPDDAATARELRAYPLDANRASLIREALSTRRPVLVRDVRKEELAALSQSDAHLAILRRVRPRSYIAVPLEARGRLLGCLLIIRKYAELTEAELRVAEEVAALAAVAIDNARLYREATSALDARRDRLAIVAHDLRNPISNMVMASGLLKLRLHEANIDGLDGILAGIARTATYVTRLVDDLTDAAGLGGPHFALNRVPLPVATLLGEVAEDHADAAREAGIALHIGEAPPCTIDGDPHRLLQVFSNLVSNALKFTAPGGEVRIEGVAFPDHVRFAVADTGRGITAEKIGGVFDPFWRDDDRPNRGLGLGLAIAREIVSRHGGQLSVRSEPGVGSEFSFTIPLAIGAETGSAVRADRSAG